MYKLILLFFLVNLPLYSQNTEVNVISDFLDNWHKAATDAKITPYFDVMDSEFVFIGTDATENWDKKEFRAFAKPYFDKGNAWVFKKIDRHIFVNKQQNFAWFDELLSTDMKICRGSGVLEKNNGMWKIKQYVLSMTIPNQISSQVISIKSNVESKLIDTLESKK